MTAAAALAPFRRFALGLTLAALAMTPASAADDWNPRADEGDIIFALPCDLGMVFRRVTTTQGGAAGDASLLDDRLVRLGSPDEDGGYLDYLRNDFISGHFTDSDSRFYLIGKYEVTLAQYKSLMQDGCSFDDEDVFLPASRVSWYDGVEFSRRLSAHLLSTERAAVEAAVGSPGAFARLPTEAEWEFAARGGLAVSLAEFQDSRFPMSGDLINYAWIAGPTSSGGDLNYVGSLDPNPLKIYDIYGNVGEMMIEPFRLNKVGRAHGMAGGYIVKGGSFLGSAEDAQSAKRIEQPLFRLDDGQETSGEQFGMRMVIAGPALATQLDLQALDQAWQAAGSPQLEANNDVVGLISSLQERQSDLQLSRDLDTIKQAVRQDNSMAAERQDRLLRTLVLSSAKMVDDIRSLYGQVTSRQSILGSSVRANFSPEDIAGMERAISGYVSDIQDLNLFNHEILVSLANEFTPDQIRTQSQIIIGDIEQRGFTSMAKAARRSAALAALIGEGEELSRERILSLTLSAEE